MVSYRFDLNFHDHNRQKVPFHSFSRILLKIQSSPIWSSMSKITNVKNNTVGIKKIKMSRIFIILSQLEYLYRMEKCLDNLTNKASSRKKQETLINPESNKITESEVVVVQLLNRV